MAWLILHLEPSDKTINLCYAKFSVKIIFIHAFWVCSKNHPFISRKVDYLVFDSKFTTLGNLGRINDEGIKFITIQRRSKNLNEKIQNIPASQWKASGICITRIFTNWQSRSDGLSSFLSVIFKMHSYDSNE